MNSVAPLRYHKIYKYQYSLLVDSSGYPRVIAFGAEGTGFVP